MIFRSSFVDEGVIEQPNRQARTHHQNDNYLLEMSPALGSLSGGTTSKITHAAAVVSSELFLLPQLEYCSETCDSCWSMVHASDEVSSARARVT